MKEIMNLEKVVNKLNNIYALNEETKYICCQGENIQGEYINFKGTIEKKSNDFAFVVFIYNNNVQHNKIRWENLKFIGGGYLGGGDYLVSPSSFVTPL